MIAHRSSITATAVRNIFSEAGALLPTSATTLSAKAISVAIGMPNPFWVGSPLLNPKWIRAGTAMPPSAAKIGSIALFMSESSPW